MSNATRPIDKAAEKPAVGSEESLKFSFGYPHDAKATDKKSSTTSNDAANATPFVASVSLSSTLDFKFNFGFIPDQEPSRKTLRPHGQATDTGRISEPAPKLVDAQKREDDTHDQSKPQGTQNPTTFAFSFSNIAPPKDTVGDGMKAVFKFPIATIEKTDNSVQRSTSTQCTDGAASLVTKRGNTVNSLVERKDYQNKNSLFEGGDVECYHYSNTENTWVTQNKGYLQIIKMDESPDEFQLVFSRVGTNVVAINARIRKDAGFTQDKKRYLKVPIYNNVTKAAAIILFKFASEDLRSECYKAMKGEVAADSEAGKEPAKEEAKGDAEKGADTKTESTEK